MNRKIFAGVFGVVVLLLVVAWQLAGGLGVGAGVGDVSESSSTLYSTMAPGVTVNIDGIASGGEWDRASYASIEVRAIGYTTTRSVSIWLMNDDSFLYIMFLWGDSTQDIGDLLWFYFDEEHDHWLTRPSAGEFAYYEEGVRHMRSEDVKARSVLSGMVDGYWNGVSWTNEAGGLNVDYETSWSWTGSGYRSEWKIPLNSQDRLDINVKSGAILGLYIKIYDATDDQLWAYPFESGVPATDETENPSAWDDLWTTKVFSASMPHVHDDVTSWRAFVGVQNTGTKPSTVVFRFSDGYVTDRTLTAGEHLGEYAKDLHGGTNFIGSILVYSDQPFTASLGQRDAARDIGFGFIYVGEN